MQRQLKMFYVMKFLQGRSFRKMRNFTVTRYVFIETLHGVTSVFEDNYFVSRANIDHEERELTSLILADPRTLKYMDVGWLVNWSVCCVGEDRGIC